METPQDFHIQPLVPLRATAGDSEFGIDFAQQKRESRSLQQLKVPIADVLTGKRAEQENPHPLSLQDRVAIRADILRESLLQRRVAVGQHLFPLGLPAAYEHPRLLALDWLSLIG